jgi:hypothetical protein
MAAFRQANFFTGFRSSNGATPAKLFQVSTRRDAGQKNNGSNLAGRDPAHQAPGCGFSECDGFKRRGSDHERHFA